MKSQTILQRDVFAWQMWQRRAMSQRARQSTARSQRAVSSGS